MDHAGGRGLRLPAGSRQKRWQRCQRAGNEAYYWTSTESGGDAYFFICTNQDLHATYIRNKGRLLAVRLVRSARAETYSGGSGQSVSLTLAAETRDGYQFKQYATTGGTITAQTETSASLTMPAANVTISAEYDKLYNATFATGNDNTGWDIDPTSGISGSTVTVSYVGPHKVKSVTVTRISLCALSEVTSEHVGNVIGADGNVYATAAQANKVTTVVGIVGKVTETGHGLIMSLEDAPKQVWATINGWASETNYAGTTLKVLPDDDARGSNLPSYTTLGSTTVSNWAVATRADYTAIFTNLGSTRSDSDGKTYDDNVNAYITGAGGTAISGENWSSTGYNDTNAWRFSYSNYWGARDKTTQYKVRPVLGF